ncbi:OmpA family protein [Candidatus Poribacteria bacterium]|nr:OmpA family protein [Candidatus Poribacteria bacterium]
MQCHRFTTIPVLLVILLVLIGCAGQVDPIVLETSLQYAQNAVSNARRMQAETYAKEQLEKATQLLEQAESVEDGIQSLELAFQAQMEAQIAGAQARQRIAEQQIDQVRKADLKVMIQEMEYKVKTAQTRQAIAEERAKRALIRALRAEQRAETAQAEADEAREDAQTALARAKVKLAISEAQLFLDVAKETEAMTYAQDDYQATVDLIKQANALINRGKFEEAKEAAVQAKARAKVAHSVATSAISKVVASKAGAQTEVTVAIARAQVELDRADDANAFVHAEEFFQQATTKLGDATQALKSEQHDEAIRLARQAESIARKAYNVAESVERQRKAEEAREEQIAQAKDVIFKVEEGINLEAGTQVPNLASGLYEQAKTLLADAQEALGNEDYQHTLAVGRQSLEVLNRAIEKVKQIESVEKRIIDAAGVISSAEITQTQMGVLIRFSGDLFKSGSTELNPKFFPMFRQLAEIIKPTADYSVRIEGHSDSIGDAKTNLKLTEKRADAFMTYLVEKCGVPKEQMTAVGLGESKPIATNVNKAGRAKNRRIDTIILTRESEVDN